ncbi:hypothetical protein EGW08_006647 [Elysia chlorotica]|uniref:Uncharacterized protein n=1 Tax=Elysia chlorotica TaxID=188477 RepID=A0A3S0ZS69_ELYCH|nr:hypothetical protein EGW08_006647 [Elysia chlorotica]
MSGYEFVHTASPRKLPFLHSKFKPSSKFAKAFSGCSKFSKLKQSASQDEEEFLRLPRISYNAQDIRDAPPPFGSAHRGSRREYPGFTGSTKIRRHTNTKNTRSSSSQPTAIGVRNSSWDFQSSEEDKYIPFPSPREQKEDFDGRNADPSYDWSQAQTSATKRRDQRLVNGTTAAQAMQNKETEVKDSNSKVSELLSDVDSLFIGDDVEETTEGPGVSDACKTTGQGSLEKPEESTSKTSAKDQRIRFADSVHFGNEENSGDEEAKNDPFAKNFEEKLREVRGKSGVKRDRERKRLQKKKRDCEVRPLGDVITAKRLQELLSPRNEQGVTIRLHS